MFGFFKENREVQKMINTKYQVIFYAENAYYFQYFRHLFEELCRQSVKICYLTSDKNDPLLNSRLPSVDVVYSKSTLAFAFQKLQADVMIMTMPDLGNFIFKRSAGVKKYIYVFHAMVSTHQQYRSGAFDHYDAIFCVGPHHQQEVREAEALFGTAAKELPAYGYPLLYDLEERSAAIDSNRKKILIAPSWYEEGILQSCIHEVVQQLAKLDYETVIRPHPEFIKRNKKSLPLLEKTVHQLPQLSVDRNPVLWESLLGSHYLVTDRSGIAFEYALVKSRPVIFIDTPLKIQNKEIAKFRILPVENRFRENIGIAVDPAALGKLPAALLAADERQSHFSDQIEVVKKQVLFEDRLQEGVTYILAHIS